MIALFEQQQYRYNIKLSVTLQKKKAQLKFLLIIYSQF